MQFYTQVYSDELFDTIASHFDGIERRHVVIDNVVSPYRNNPDQFVFFTIRWSTDLSVGKVGRHRMEKEEYRGHARVRCGRLEIIDVEEGLRSIMMEEEPA